MLRTRKGKWGLMLLGLAFLVWGATSAFSDWKTLAALQPDALDNPDQSNAQWIYPTNVPTSSVPAAGSTSAGGTTSTPFLPGATVTPKTADTVGPSASPSAESMLSGDAQAFTVPYTPAPSPTPAPAGMNPERIVIPAIHLDAPIESVPYRLVKDDATGMTFQQWQVPDKFAVGWQGNSAQLGVPGNTVLDGHHNEWGMVFRYLVDLKPGQEIDMYSGDTKFTYTITNKMILPERNQPINVRLSNARWLLPSSDERITLVTCWPFTSNTHRLIIVAVPSGKPDVISSQPSP